MQSQHLPHAIVAETRYPPAHLPNHPDQYPVIDLLTFQKTWLAKKAALKNPTKPTTPIIDQTNTTPVTT